MADENTHVPVSTLRKEPKLKPPREPVLVTDTVVLPMICERPVQRDQGGLRFTYYPPMAYMHKSNDPNGPLFVDVSRALCTWEEIA